jgi:hypothetical protein
MTTARISDYCNDPVFMRFLRKSAKLREEVTDFRAIPRTATWDPTLDTGLAPGP